ncbi:hypothetical protein CL654_02385 [bacterium]|nr:hypothetical protein [bacterium]|tara:strand:+ start:14670 stop:15452 length:783 start_codon:yes stop_codon:yes gene_type:complete
MKNLRENLIQFGLSDKEADVYLALLSAGPSLGSVIAQKAKINRSTTYLHLDTLIKKGLVSVSEENKIKTFTPAPPDRIIHLLEESLSKYTELLHVADAMLPDLKKMYATEKKKEDAKPKVQLFEGTQGLKSAYEDMLETNDDVRTYASMEDIHTLLPEYFPKYYKRRAEKGTQIRVIFPDIKKVTERVKAIPSKIRDARVLSKEAHDFSPEINIYGSKIAFISPKEQFGLIIDSSELSNALKTIFEISWLAAKKLSLQTA